MSGYPATWVAGRFFERGIRGGRSPSPLFFAKPGFNEPFLDHDASRYRESIVSSFEDKLRSVGWTAHAAKLERHLSALMA